MENNQENLTVSDISIIEKFKMKASEFMQALARLNSIEDIPPNLQEEFSGLIFTANSVQSTIGWVTETIDSLSGYFSDFFDFNGVGEVKGYINGNGNSLGFVSLLPMAAITAAIAAMSKFIADVYIFERKITEQKRLEATGMNPDQAANVVNKIEGQGLVKSLEGIAKPLGFALGLFFVSRIVKSYLK